MSECEAMERSKGGTTRMFGVGVMVTVLSSFNLRIQSCQAKEDIYFTITLKRY